MHGFFFRKVVLYNEIRVLIKQSGNPLREMPIEACIECEGRSQNMTMYVLE